MLEMPQLLVVNSIQMKATRWYLPPSFPILKTALSPSGGELSRDEI